MPDEEWTSRNIYEDNPVGLRGIRNALHTKGTELPVHDTWFLPGAHLQPLFLSRVPRRLPETGDLQEARGRDRSHRPGAVPRLPEVRQGLPLQ